MASELARCSEVHQTSSLADIRRHPVLGICASPEVWTRNSSQNIDLITDVSDKQSSVKYTNTCVLETYIGLCLITRTLDYTEGGTAQEASFRSQHGDHLLPGKPS